jgi:drug/metabolite transporter (DMT)-like permease
MSLSSSACPAPVAASVAPHRPFLGLDRTTALLLAGTLLAWSSAFAAIRAGLSGFGPAELGAARFAIAAGPAALFLLITRPALPERHELWRFFIGGFLFVALYTVLLNVGEQTVSAGPAAFIINLNPIITAALAMVVLSEPFGLRAWIGTALSLAGVALIALGEGQGMRIDLGALMILGAALCNSIASVAQKPLFARHKALTVAAWNILIGTLFLVPWMPSAVAQSATASSQALFAAVFLGIVPSLVGYATWTMLLARMPVSRASNFMYCVPPVAVVVGYLWLGETPSSFALIGGALALAGVVVVNLARAAR